MALFPLSSNFEGDFVIQVVVVDDGATMDEVAAACAVHSVNRRVAPGRARSCACGAIRRGKSIRATCW
ncbi:toluene-4-monooxygenase system B family protein [Oleomonas cavernae]|uniref:toluene-4-monooxygenase system B family protein n=1 Tax=Oleomonas cavernae TaxID=2320859 RepID=UPI0018F2EA64